MSERLVVLQTFTSLVEAELARGMLENAGIAAVVSADDCGGMRPELRLGMGVRLLVAESDAAAAQMVLETRSDNVDD